MVATPMYGNIVIEKIITPQILLLILAFNDTHSDDHSYRPDLILGMRLN